MREYEVEIVVTGSSWVQQLFVYVIGNDFNDAATKALDLYSKNKKAVFQAVGVRLKDEA